MAEERRHNLFDDINSGISGITNGLKTAKFGAALSSSFWGWIILGTIFSLGFITFTMDMGNEGAASEGTQTEMIPEQTQNTTLTTNISNYFNIVGATDSQNQEILSALSDAMRFPTYSKLLTTDGLVTINYSQGCGGFVGPPYTDINLKTTDCLSLTKFYLTHETGHIIAGRNGRLWQRFFEKYHGDGISPSLITQDKGCYDPDGYLVTYPRTSAEGNPDWESFAEAVALFMYPKQYPNKLQNFSIECQATYNWIGNNVYQERQ